MFRESDKDQQIEKWTGFAPGGVVWPFKSGKRAGEDSLVGTRCNLRGVKGQYVVTRMSNMLKVQCVRKGLFES